MDKKYQRISLQIKSLITCFDENGCRPEAISYIDEIKNALQQKNYSTILLCLKELCRIYKIEIKDKDSDIANLGKITFVLQQILDDELKAKIENEKLEKFWTAFITWFENIEEDENIIKTEYFEWGNYRSNHASINYDYLYKLNYGIPYQSITDNLCFDNIKNFIELVFNEIVSINNGRLQFTIKVNKLFTQFKLPYRLEKGTISLIGYKTSEVIDCILNYEQFERKIKYSEDMIVHKDYMDKHSALSYIADAFCYFFSLFKNNGTKILEDKKVYIKLANLVCPDMNTKAYALIKQEIADVKRIINNDYDIRHNEYYTTAKPDENRELLMDVKLVEYIYNKIYNLLFILRLNYKKQNNDN